MVGKFHPVKVGVIAVQGDVSEHISALEKALDRRIHQLVLAPLFQEKVSPPN